MSSTSDSVLLLGNSDGGPESDLYNYGEPDHSRKYWKKVIDSLRVLNIPLCLLIITFSWSAWVGFNCITAEFPLLVIALPEYWKLPSYVSLVSQIANVGPIIFLLAVWCMRRSRWGPSGMEIPANIFIISFGTLASAILIFTWRMTVFVSGHERSLPLFLLTFGISLVDSTSSLTFLAYMHRFPSEYMPIYYIGEGMSSLIPAMLALGQGSGRYECVSVIDLGSHYIKNGTDSSRVDTMVAKVLPETFSVEIYFGLIFVMMLLSLSAFLSIEYLTYFKRLQTPRARDVHERQFGNEWFVKPPNAYTGKDIALCLVMSLIGNAVIYGILPGLQTFALLPFGPTYFSLGIKLSLIATPLGGVGALFIKTLSMRGLKLLLLISLSLLTYILIFAGYSPNPPLVDTSGGGEVMVVAWILVLSNTTYLKVNIATILKEQSQYHLVWYGAFCQLGSALGSALVFVVINVLGLLMAPSQC